MAVTREEGVKQINIYIQAQNEGINITQDIFENLDYKNTYLEQVRSCFDWNFKSWTKTKLPSGFRIKSSGFEVPIYLNPKSELKIIKEGEKYYFVKGDGKDFAEEINFEHKPGFYNKVTSDGKDMSRIVQAGAHGRLFISYSNECSFLEKGRDCLFCNINDTKRRFGKVDNIEWKNPNQIGETIAEAYREGYEGFNLTGGYVPERREVEYYIDVIEAVKDHTDLPDDRIHGMACVGAPSDFSFIEKYKEAGYQHIACNMEVWDKNLFNYYCPGKVDIGGDHDRWLDVLKHEVEVFGRGNVRSNFVGGLESKDSLLEGIEELAELGVIGVATTWKPCIGSALEGHRSPETEWHQNLQAKIYQILKKNGYTLSDLYYVSGDLNPIGYYFALDGQISPGGNKFDIKK